MKDYTDLQWTYSSSSSGGQYLKSEKTVNGKLYYYKLSDYFYGTFRSHESALEVFTSRLGIYLGLPVLKYTGSRAKISLDGREYETFVSRSKNFCPSGGTSIPLVTYYNINKLPKESPLEFCRRTGMTEYIDKVIIFDYLIMNIDRHGRNIEMIINGNQITPSPIFDNGRCLTFGCGNRTYNIKKYDYKSPGMGNNFVGSIDLERNLSNVSRQYILPELCDEIRPKLFHGLHSEFTSEHRDILWEALKYRYNILKSKGVIK